MFIFQRAIYSYRYIVKDPYLKKIKQSTFYKTPQYYKHLRSQI